MSVERKAEAVKDEQQGLLNLIKSMKEIETTDIGHIRELFSLSDILMNRQKMKEEESSAGKTERKAEAIAATAPRQEVQQQPQQQLMQQGGMQG